tara:strand:+ start:2501 stop:3025 length:525 start_codon:yes stop_codon:yes gene_type:complete
MLTEPLPTLLDMRKLASRNTQIMGVLQLAKLPRLTGLVVNPRQLVEVNCRFENSEEGHSVLSLQFATELDVECQRCMEPVSITVAVNTDLGIVWDEEQEKALPSYLEPLVLEEGNGDLWSVVEDELILSLPIVSYHDDGYCVKLKEQYSLSKEQINQVQKPSPFQILESLKSKK